MKADLHCHSYFSDGKHAPAELMAMALENGLSHLAITDHDCIDAHLDLVSSDALTIISGVEISCAWDNREIHIVGLGIETGNSDLCSLLARQQANRRERISSFDEQLAKLGITGLTETLELFPCRAYTRTHVAEFLVNNGHAKNIQKAFKKYLSRRGKIYVPAKWCEMALAIETIQAAGGLAILAHPGRYPLSKRKLQGLLADFRDAGGDAMEVTYGNIHPDMQKALTELAESFGLFASQGSDFHDAAAHWTRPGKFPALNSQAIKNAIWLHPGWHF